MIVIAHPEFFWLFLLPFLVYLIFPNTKSYSDISLRVPFIEDLKKIKNEVNNKYFPKFGEKFLFSLKVIYLSLMWALLVLAASRPQFLGEPFKLKTQNRDIMLVIDISTSMLQKDFLVKDYRVNSFYIDRLTAVKHVVSDFIKQRKDDRLGLILFGTRAYLQSPLTFDKAAINEILQSVDAGMAGNSTAIGDALGAALKNIRNEKDKENKSIILLSDGESNDGFLSMAQAIDMAEKEGIKVYTIGVGSETGFIGSLFNIKSNELDEKSLKELAQRTKGNYFKATSLASLQQVYQEIDKMEPKTNDSDIVQEKRELFYLPVIAVLLLSIALIFYLKRGKE